MLQQSMRLILESCYGDTPKLKFFMRPQTHLYRLLITKEILRQYIFFADAFGSDKADFFRAVANEIEEFFEKHYGPDRIELWRSHLRNNGPTLPNRPEFLKQLFSPYYPVNE